MKDYLKKFLSLSFCAIMLFSTLVVGNLAVSAEQNTYSVGDIVEFGSYPQSEVTMINDSALWVKLDEAEKNWVSYGYYSGIGNVGTVGTMKQGDWMKYADITLEDGSRYRAITFEAYRPDDVCDNKESKFSYQDDNGYATTNIYYFKFEPLQWQILDPDIGLVLCKNIIDAQPYSDTVYKDYKYYGDSNHTYFVNNYAKSTIRTWLNDNFYDTAFSKTEQKNIAPITLDNSAYSKEYTVYNSISTKDNIFLLSYNEAQQEKYGLNSDESRKATGTAYAEAQGFYNRGWRLRSAGSDSQMVCVVSQDGSISTNFIAFSSSLGIRPAMRLSNLNVKGTEYDVIINLEKGGKISIDGNNWESSVTLKVAGEETIADKIKIRPNDGYEILSVNKTVDGVATSITADEMTNGKITAETIFTISFRDILAPTIKGIENGQKYIDKVEFSVSDNDEIAAVTVNGKKIVATDGKYVLTSADVEQEVIVTDKTCNSTKIMVTVSSSASQKDNAEDAANNGDNANNGETKLSFFQKIIAFFRNIFESIKNLFS